MYIVLSSSQNSIACLKQPHNELNKFLNWHLYFIYFHRKFLSFLFTYIHYNVFKKTNTPCSILHGVLVFFGITTLCITTAVVIHCCMECQFFWIRRYMSSLVFKNLFIRGDTNVKVDSKRGSLANFCLYLYTVCAPLLAAACIFYTLFFSAVYNQERLILQTIHVLNKEIWPKF